MRYEKAKKYEELNKFIKYPIIVIFRLNWGEKHILETVVENINKKTTSKILVNILYMIISMLIRFIFVLISVIVNICGIDFSGKNFPMYLLQGFIVFSIIFFIKFKTIEKHQKNRMKRTIAPNIHWFSTISLSRINNLK